MASGTVLQPEPYKMMLPFGLDGGSDTPPNADATFSANNTSSHSDLNNDNAIQQSARSSPFQNTADNDQPMHISDAYGTDDNDEDDAMGEIDEDYNEDMHVEHNIAVNGHSSSSESSHKSMKRRHEVDEGDDFMQQNPELYGLRRSGRARPVRQLAESSDDEQNDDDVIHHGRKRQNVAKDRPASISPATSDSEDNVYGRARARIATKKQKTRRRLHHTGRSAGSSTPVNGEVRFSTRSTKVTNYNEDEDQAHSEDYFEDDAVQEWAYVEDTGPAIDQILDHRRKATCEATDTHPSKHDFEFMVKWQNQAHYHATWEDWATLSKAKGFRRLENYFRKVVQEELALLADPGTSREELERWSLDRETKIDELNERHKVERVINAREGDEGTEYLVKWKALFYESCTWESAELVSTLAQTEIDRYLDRAARLPSNNKKEMSLATRSPYEPFHSQPDFVKGGELRKFQILGVNFMARNWTLGKNVILADEMGLGKTVQTVSYISWLKNARGQEGPFIVVVPLSTLPAWADTFNHWAPDVNYVVYNGNEASRRIIRETELLVNDNPRKTKFNVLLTTYEFVNTDVTFLSQLPWQFMAVDEAHRLKNRESQLYANLLGFNSPARLLITGTPMQNTLSELSALLDFLMPGMIEVEENLDLDDEDAENKIQTLVDTFSPYMLRRTKQTVEADLPPKTEKIIRVELADVQLDYYKNIITRNVDALNSGSKHKTSLLNIVMELKKASNHAFMFPGVEERMLAATANSRSDQLKAIISSSGKMMLLDQLLNKLKKDGHRVLIFSQMVKMLDILSDFLNLRGYQYQRLDGTIPAGQRKLAIDHFNADESQDFCFLLSTRAGGLGINLMTADTVILFDSDWNPQADLQAMARAHRIGQKKPVSIYRLVSKDTIEEEVLERARNKLMLEFITIQRGVTDRDQLVRKAGAQAAEPTTSEDISRILKKRGQKMFEQSGNQKKLEDLDIDAVLENAEEHKTEQAGGIVTDGGEDFLKSFEYTDVKLDLEWDQIIPKDQLDKAREEEAQKAQQAYLNSVIDESQPRKRKVAEDDLQEGRAAKKRARNLNTKVAVDSGSDVDDNDDDDSSLDPSRPLSEKEVRNLIRAYERFGSIEEMESNIVREARLTSRNVDVVKATLKQILDQANNLLDEEQQRVADFEAAHKRPITKKERRTVLFDFKGVKRLNAETLTERPKDMRMIRELVDRTTNFSAFRVAEATKSASYTCAWGAREDGMLCVGIARHGYGAWAVISDDESLGLKDKFYLEEHRVANAQERDKGEEKIAKSPGAVHLVRRALYLFDVLRHKVSQGTNIQARRALENHHRNNRKHLSGSGAGRHSTPGGSASPATSTLRKMPSQDDRNKSGHRPDAKISKDHFHRRSPPAGHGKPDSRHRTKSALSPERLEAALSHKQSTSLPSARAQNDVDRRCSTALQPVIESLSMFKKANKKSYGDNAERAGALKKSLIAVGDHIKKEAAHSASLSVQTLWDFVAKHHWPNVKQDIGGVKLRAQYNKFSPESETSLPAVNGAAASSDVKDKIGVSDTAQRPDSTMSLKGLPSFKRKESVGTDRRPETARHGRNGDSRPLSSGSSHSSDQDRRPSYDHRREQRSRFEPDHRGTATPPYERRKSSFNGDRRPSHMTGRPRDERRGDRRDEYRPDYRGDRYSNHRSEYRSDRRDDDHRRGSDRYDRPPSSRDGYRPNHTSEHQHMERHPLPKKPDFGTSNPDNRNHTPPSSIRREGVHGLPNKVVHAASDTARPAPREQR